MNVSVDAMATPPAAVPARAVAIHPRPAAHASNATAEPKLLTSATTSNPRSCGQLNAPWIHSRCTAIATAKLARQLVHKTCRPVTVNLFEADVIASPKGTSASLVCGD